MATEQTSYVGFTCAYTPLALIDAAGYAPFRILPMGDAPDRAGQVLHDNLCPHVKRVLDRALDNDLPELAGVVLLNSCDAMRRLADAWPRVRPNDRLIFIDLPFTSDDAAVTYFSGELSRLADTLFAWNGKSVSQEAMAHGVAQYNRMAVLFDGLRQRLRTGAMTCGAARVQSLYNTAVTRPFTETMAMLNDLEECSASQGPAQDGVPVFVFGNVLPDPEAFDLFEACGVRVVDEDFCTGSRVFSPVDVSSAGGCAAAVGQVAACASSLCADGSSDAAGYACRGGYGSRHCVQRPRRHRMHREVLRPVHRKDAQCARCPSQSRDAALAD